MKSFQSQCILAYSQFWLKLCLFILRRTKLNNEEKKYVEVDGPQIIQQNYIHDVRSMHGGCPEAREARREACRLEEIAEMKLTRANVSRARQKFLEQLLFSSDANYLKEFPPKNWQDLRYHFQEMWNSKMIHMIFVNLIHV